MNFLGARLLLIASAWSVASAGVVMRQAGKLNPSPVLERNQRLDTGRSKREVAVPLRGRRVVLHVYLPKQVQPNASLVVFSSGSGGWHDFDDYVATALAENGLPVCGISTHSYLTNFYNTSRPATIEQLVADYSDIIKESKVVVGIENSRPIILAGWSLGAGYAPIIASQSSIKPNVLGVISIAIEKDNEAALSIGNRLLTRLTGRMFGPSFDIVQYLPRVSPRPVAIIQAAADHKASPQKANEMITAAGQAASTVRVFEVKSARGHSFAGGRPEFKQTLSEVLAWFKSTLEPHQYEFTPVD